jgi:phage-related protein
MDYYKTYSLNLDIAEGYANKYRNNQQPSTASFFTSLYTTFAKICRQVIMQPYNTIYSIFAFPIRIYTTIIGYLALKLFFLKRYLRSVPTTISNFQKKMSSITWTVLDFLMKLPVRIFRKLNSFIWKYKKKNFS